MLSWVRCGIGGVRGFGSSQVLRLGLTPVLSAEPLKKKKRLDPAIVKAREDKRKRRIEKQIRRLEKSSRQFKPVEECLLPPEMATEAKQRQRGVAKLSEEILNERALVMKQWAAYRHKEYLGDIQQLDRLAEAQQLALDQLKSEDKELYEAAIQPDHTLLPFTQTGPVQTPPILNYDSPDGEYTDISKKWDT